MSAEHPTSSSALFLARGADFEELIPPSSLLVTVDETGDEGLSDDAYPLFGLGGCAALAANYAVEIAEPWMALKRQHFGDPRVSLHAVNYRSWTPAQREAIGQFFASRYFARIGAVTTRATILAPGLSVYEATATGLTLQLRNILPLFDLSSITFLFESSQRGDRLAERFFRRFRVLAATEGGQLSVPLKFFSAEKGVADPLLEVADFVMHCAGSAVRDRLEGKDHRKRRDVQVVFERIGHPVASYVELTSMARPNAA